MTQDRYLFTHQHVDIYQQNGTYTFCTQQGTPGVQYCMRSGSKGLCIATRVIPKVMSNVA